MGGGLLTVVNLGHDPSAELREKGARINPGSSDPYQWSQPVQLPKIGRQRVTSTRVLQLHGDLAAVAPQGAVYLSDTGGGRRVVVELGKSPAPVAP